MEKEVQVQISCPFCGTVRQATLKVSGYPVINGIIGEQLDVDLCDCGATYSIDSYHYPEQYVWGDWVDIQQLNLHEDIIQVSGLRLGIYWAKAKG